MFAIDNALQLASIGFTQVFFHSSGAAARYNAFSVPPGNETNFLQWSVGSTFYAMLAIAEAIGPTGLAQVADLNIGGTNGIYTPAYTIVESGNPVKVALFNYVSDATGVSDYQAAVSVPAGQAQVRVKYLLGQSASTKQNITWGGQTLGSTFHVSDGRLMNPLDVVTVPCSAGTCLVPMSSPSFAIVYLTDQALNDVTATGIEAATFATTVTTRRLGHIFVDPSVLATSNGNGGAQELLKAKWQATSHGSTSPAIRVGVSLGLGLGLVIGALATMAAVRV